MLAWTTAGIAMLLLLLLHAPAVLAGSYAVSFTGLTTGNSTPAYMGLGMGHGAAASNYAWLKYLKPNAVRVFVTSINDWRNFVDSRDPKQWGVSFTGQDVINEDVWRGAVASVRSVSNAPGEPNFLDWLAVEPSIRWSSFLKSLREPSGAEFLRCLGTPERILAQLNAMKVRILVVWHVTCKNLLLSEMDSSSAEYWRQRWELYRWFYAGGRFLADSKVKNIELYNEPDLDACLLQDAWVEEYTIRSLALQHAYADHSSRAGKTLSPTLSGPPMSSPKYLASLGKLGLDNVGNKFPDGPTQGWRNQKGYSYHQYNTPGYGMRSAYDRVALEMKADGKPLPITVSEYNCYADSLAQAQSVDIMDKASTGACLAGQVASLLGRAYWTSVQKATQTPSAKPSGVVKNGLMWGDSGAGGQGSRGFCDVGGTTKSAEAYRLILRKTPNKKLYQIVTTPPIKLFNNHSMHMVADLKAYYFYSHNYDTVTQTLAFSFSKLPGVAASAPVVISAVTDGLHGQVERSTRLSATETLTYVQPKLSTHMFTVPRVGFTESTLTAFEDTTLAAGARSNSAFGGADGTLTVRTSTSGDQSLTQVALIRFSTGSFTASKVITAVLQLSVASCTSSQILTVLGTKAPWTEGAATWNGLPGALLSQPNGVGVTSIASNFINWQGSGDIAAPVIVGHLSVSTTLKSVALDVSDYVRAGGSSFLVVRMWRRDASGAGPSAIPPDSISGEVVFKSSEAVEGKPTLRLVVSKN